MPELPEVQATVDGLKRRVVGRKIKDIWADWPKVLKDPLDQSKIKHNHIAWARKFLRNEKIISMGRRAKNVLVYLSNKKVILIHQKMTGHLLVGKWRVKNNKVTPISPRSAVNDPWNGYIRLVFYLSDGNMIGFSDLRRFGKIVLGSKEEIENLPEIKNLGPEPLDKSFMFGDFRAVLRNQKRKIKPVLMDPGVIAGIGNIYSDEILWRARVSPKTNSNKLSEQDLKNIFSSMKFVLEKAVKLRGTSISDYRKPDGKEGGYAPVRLVYGREGEPCKRCKAKIVREKIAGRSAHYCPKCQKI
jgi:formamidopyrimidine-DNA glycosylase